MLTPDDIDFLYGQKWTHRGGQGTYTVCSTHLGTTPVLENINHVITSGTRTEIRKHFSRSDELCGRRFRLYRFRVLGDRILYMGDMPLMMAADSHTGDELINFTYWGYDLWTGEYSPMTVQWARPIIEKVENHPMDYRIRAQIYRSGAAICEKLERVNRPIMWSCDHSGGSYVENMAMSEYDPHVEALLRLAGKFVIIFHPKD